VQITFDPREISYADLLKVFFSIHDPTTLNRQGADVGTQYRSVVLYHSPEQKRAAEEAIRSLDEQRLWDRPIVTQVEPLQQFYQAEDYHQEYFARNGMQPYCNVVIAPKVAKFRKHYVDMLKA
jgi:peptide-methionine (S)-S-oxide reductase